MRSSPSRPRASFDQADPDRRLLCKNTGSRIERFVVCSRGLAGGGGVAAVREQGAYAFDMEPANDVTGASRPATSPHAGHRQRLRTRAAISFAALPDYELLELLLSRSLPPRRLKPIAKALLARFGGLAGVLGAEREELQDSAGRRRRRGARSQAAARGDGASRARRDCEAHRDLLLERPAGLCPGRHGQRPARAVPGDVPRQEEPAHRRRGDERGHGRPRPGLSARGRAPGAWSCRPAPSSWPTTTHPATPRRRRPTWK